MKLLGIDFVPLNLPLRDHIQALSAGIYFFLLLGLMVVGYLLTIYMLLFSKYWLYFCVYLIWIWLIDNGIQERGGRINEWVRSWTLFKNVHKYFPIHLRAVPGFKVDPRKNYLLCSFPHGALPLGTTSTLFTSAYEQSKDFYPHHVLRGLTLNSNFYIPIYREFLLAIGLCGVTRRSIDWLLSRPEGGNFTALVVGGAAESFYCGPGHYQLVLKNRKGFVKLALIHGAPLIPMFAFGQNDIFKPIAFQEGSTLRRIQNLVKKLTGIAPIMFYGRGLFQYTFGFIPIQKPINIIIGMPIDVQKTENPTQEDIDALHTIFIQKLTELFEEYKYEYDSDPENSFLTVS